MGDKNPEIVLYVSESLHRRQVSINGFGDLLNGYAPITPIHLSKEHCPDAQFVACIPKDGDHGDDGLPDRGLFDTICDYSATTVSSRGTTPGPISGSLRDILLTLPLKGVSSDTGIAIINPFCLFCDPGEFQSALDRFRSNGRGLVATCQEASPHPWEMLRFHEKKGIAENSLPVCYEDLWTLDFKHFRLVRSSDGAPLYRRQDFPIFFELNYGLIVGSKKDLLNMDRILRTLPGHLFPCRHTVLIKSKLDIIKAFVKTREFQNRTISAV